MPTSHSRRRRVRRYLRRVPLLPSLLTLGNAFCGFLAIVKVADAARLAGPGPLPAEGWQLVETAGLLLFLAMVFDGLDGKVARLTRQSTEFGAQLDSLADVITFGIAPAVLGKFVIDVHQSPAGGGELLPHQVLPYHPKIYYLCAAIFVLFAVLRLARFNVEVTDHRERAHLEFEGLPSPAAATVVAALVLFLCGRGERNSLSGLFFDEGIYRSVVGVMPAVLVGCALLMVSRVPYPHVLNRLLRGPKSFPHLVAAVILLILAVLEWQIVIVGLGLGYLAAGPLIGAWRLLGGRRPTLGDRDLDEEEGPEFEEELDEADEGADTDDGPRRFPDWGRMR